MRRLGIFLLVLVVLGLEVPSASAHGYLVRSIPEDRAVLDRPPTRLQYWFSEALEPEFSRLNLRDQQGEVLATGGLSDNDNRLLTLNVPSDLPDGAYIVELRPAFASDGHAVSESRVFFVGAEIGGVAGVGLSDKAVPLEVVWRALAVTSTIILFGISALYSMVLLPAWGSVKYPAGNLPPRVMRRLNVIFGYALLMAFAGNLLALIQQTMTFFNVDFMRAIQPEFWGLVRVGSRFGDIWNWRMMFLGGAGVLFLLSLYHASRQPSAVRAYWMANVWLLALVIGSYSVLSHAAGSLLWPWMAILSDWLHALSVGFWVGALIPLALVLPVALSPYQGDARRTALLAALRNFSRVALKAAVMVIVTGIYNSANWIFSPSEAQTTYGSALILKVGLVAVLLGIGALHHIALNPARYARLDAISARVQGFLPTIRLEAVFALIVLMSAALLSATPLPQPDFINQDVNTPTQAQDLGDYTVALSITPGGPGVNTHDVVVTQGGQRVSDVGVTLVNTRPETAYRGSNHLLEAIEDGLYVTATADIDSAGRWWSLLDLTLPDGQAQRLAFEWEIDANAAVIESLEPNLQNYVALMAVVMACLWVVYPLLRRGLEALNLDAVSVTIALVTILFTAIVMIGGYVIVQQTRDSYAQTLRPPAQVINAVLPTQSSLERGADLYTEHCISWQSQPRDFNALRDGLATIRDDDLYSVVTDGWRTLEGCGADLDVSQQWDVVNYLRMLAR